MCHTNGSYGWIKPGPERQRKGLAMNLFLMCHATPTEPDENVDDNQRPLTEKGRKKLGRGAAPRLGGC
jgi:hypothetical protein